MTDEHENTLNNYEPPRYRKHGKFCLYSKLFEIIRVFWQGNLLMLNLISRNKRRDTMTHSYHHCAIQFLGKKINVIVSEKILVFENFQIQKVLLDELRKGWKYFVKFLIIFWINQ